MRKIVEEFPRHRSERTHQVLTGPDAFGGWKVNFKRVHRIWKEEHMQVPRKQRKRRRLPGSSVNGCIRHRAADGRGYTMEYAIPWRLLNCEDDPPQPGDALGVSWQVLFADEGGRLWWTQILEVRNPDEPPRIYTWERAATWGRAEYQ
jgi:hypothetical protein